MTDSETEEDGHAQPKQETPASDLSSVTVGRFESLAPASSLDSSNTIGRSRKREQQQKGGNNSYALTAKRTRKDEVQGGEKPEAPLHSKSVEDIGVVETRAFLDKALSPMPPPSNPLKRMHLMLTAGGRRNDYGQQDEPGSLESYIKEQRRKIEAFTLLRYISLRVHRRLNWCISWETFNFGVAQGSVTTEEVELLHLNLDHLRGLRADLKKPHSTLSRIVLSQLEIFDCMRQARSIKNIAESDEMVHGDEDSAVSGGAAPQLIVSYMAIDNKPMTIVGDGKTMIIVLRLLKKRES